MALARKSNAKRNMILLIVLGVVIVGAIIWYYYSSRPLDTTGFTSDIISGGRRDINKIKEFNQTDFVNGDLFKREDYLDLDSHGEVLTEPGPANRTNPFTPPL
ncbi:MAG: hypothetical protein V1838_01360 [Patescibacteria group bacterium]